MGTKMPSLFIKTRDIGASKPEGQRDTLTGTLRAEVANLIREVVFLFCLLRHADTQWYVKSLILLPLLYLCSPIQLIPNFIPVLGQIDDIFLIWVTKKLAWKLVAPKTWDECQDAATKTRYISSRRFAGVATQQADFTQGQPESIL
jgi:uncharacterized membrane protein YkvA (DUF1232 family)